MTSARGSGSTFRETSVISPEDAQRAAQQARDIKAGDVLHDLSAEAQQLAIRRQQPRAEHEVARGAGIHAPRSGQSRRDDAAQGRVAPEGRGLEGEELAFSGKRRFDLRQRRAAARA